MAITAVLGLTGCSESGAPSAAETVVAAVAEPAKAPSAPAFASGDKVWITVPGGALTPNNAAGLMALQAVPSGATVFRPSHAEGLVVSIEGNMAKVQVTMADLLGEAGQQAAYIKAGAAPFVPVAQLHPFEAGRGMAAAAQTAYTYLFYRMVLLHDQTAVVEVSPWDRTIAALRGYLAKHPAGRHRKDATARLASLEEKVEAERWKRVLGGARKEGNG